MARKGNPVPQFNDPDWMTDFGYLTHISLHLSDLNIRLQGKNQFIHNLHDQIKSFQNKLRLWEIQLQKNDFTHFPTLSQCKVTNSPFCSQI
jgi:hypothetical protein